MNIPIKFETEMKKLLGDSDYQSYLSSLEKPRRFGLRVNNLKISTEEFLRIAPFSLRPIPWIDNGFFYEEQDRPSHHPYYYAGLFYIQEPSAMTPASVLPVNPGDKVLDMCAAPGGKSTELAVKLAGEGLIVSNDISASRAKALLKNIELFGITNACVISEDTDKILNTADFLFDKIMLDAPCSGEGMFRKDGKLIKAWEKQGPEFYSPIQKQLILNAADLLKPGGMILYSTCTFSKMENEDTIAYLIREREDMELVEFKHYETFSQGFTDTEEEKNIHAERAARLFPHRTDGEGHFVALIRKKPIGDMLLSDVDKETREESRKSKNRFKKNNLPSALLEFLNNFNDSLGGRLEDCKEVGTFKIDTDRIITNGDKVFMLPKIDYTEGKNTRVLRNGLMIGELKKDRFEPACTFALALKASDYKNTLSLPATDIRIDKYLKGETIILSEEEKNHMGLVPGFVLVAVDGYTLGWGKLSGTTLKNKYLAGWRKMS